MNKAQKKKVVFSIICMVLVFVMGMGYYLWYFLTSPYNKTDVKVYDLNSESGINATNINRLTNDGTHPNARGQMKIAWKVKKLVEMSKKVDGK